MEGLIFEGAYLWGEICVLKFETGVFVVGRKFTIFALFYFVFESKFQVQPPREGFLCYDFGGLIFGRAYTWRALFSEFYGRFSSNLQPTCINAYEKCHLVLLNREFKIPRQRRRRKGRSKETLLAG